MKMNDLPHMTEVLPPLGSASDKLAASAVHDFLLLSTSHNELIDNRRLTFRIAKARPSIDLKNVSRD